MICKKIGYNTFAEANDALTSCIKERKEGDKSRKEKRLYECAKCGRYHLTSISAQKKELINKIRVIKAAKTAMVGLRKKYKELPKFEKIPKRRRKLS